MFAVIASTMPPDDGTGIVITCLPRYENSIGSRHTALYEARSFAVMRPPPAAIASAIAW